MNRVRKLLPTPAMVVAVVALVAAMAGTSIAFGLGALSNGAKNKTIGVGKLNYTSTTTAIPAFTVTAVSALCPSGQSVIGGGIKFGIPNADNTVIVDSYATTSGWAGHVHSNAANSAVTTAICAKSRVVTGTPPTP